MIRRTIALAVLAGAALLAAAPAASGAQRKGDYLTEEELEIVRDLQQDIHKRAEVFLAVADRRLAVLTDPAAEPDGRLSKSMGPLRAGTHVELLDDYRRAIEELMVKLEDEYERKGLSAPLKKALELARDRTEKQIAQIEALKPKLSGADASQFAVKAIATARDLNDGARAALAGQ